MLKSRSPRSFLHYLPMTAAISAMVANAAIGSPVKDDFSIPPPAELNLPSLELWATHYFVYSAKEGQSGIPLQDKTGQALTGNLSLADWCLGAMEGTIQITSAGHRYTFNYAGLSTDSQVDCASIFKRVDPLKSHWIKSIGKSYFAPAKGPYGDGVQPFILVPFRTIAVDGSKIPYGTVLFIPKARGVEIPTSNGSVKHDGYFFAADRGGGIKGAHIDVFCGTFSKNCFPSFVTSTPAKPFQAFVVGDPAIKAKLEAIHTQ